jgi:uncharacterized phosphosugar-binding protein
MKEVFDMLHHLVDELEEANTLSIHAAGTLVADCLEKNKLVHVFGTGHSHIMCEELFFRAGGIANISPILDSGLMLHESALTSTDLERIEGYAAIIMSRYNFSPGDVMIVISNSGRNPVPIEAAMEARKMGLPIIVVTAKSYSAKQSSRHSSGKRLFELADVVLDNCGKPGDASLDVDGLPFRIFPTSTISGAILVNSVIYEAVKQLLARGVTPPILVSGNIDKDQNIPSPIKDSKLHIRHV